MVPYLEGEAFYLGRRKVETLSHCVDPNRMKWETQFFPLSFGLLTYLQFCCPPGESGRRVVVWPVYKSVCKNFSCFCSSCYFSIFESPIWAPSIEESKSFRKFRYLFCPRQKRCNGSEMRKGYKVGRSQVFSASFNRQPSNIWFWKLDVNLGENK